MLLTTVARLLTQNVPLLQWTLTNLKSTGPTLAWIGESIIVNRALFSFQLMHSMSLGLEDLLYIIQC